MSAREDAREQRESQPPSYAGAKTQMRQERQAYGQEKASQGPSKDKKRLDTLRRQIADAQTFLRSEEVRSSVASQTFAQLLQESLEKLVGPEQEPSNVQSVSNRGRSSDILTKRGEEPGRPERLSYMQKLQALDQTIKEIRKSAAFVRSNARNNQVGVRNG